MLKLSARPRLHACLAIALLLTAAARAYSIEEIARVDGLLRVLEQRLQLSDLVARSKWTSGTPIEDTAREAKVLSDFQAQATSQGLDAEVARVLMRAQIEASKIRQRQLFAEWKARRLGPFSNPPDLASEVRPRLDEISRQLMAAIRSAGPVLHDHPELVRWRAEILWGAGMDSPRRRAIAPFSSSSLTSG
jgi:chorismate mutase